MRLLVLSAFLACRFETKNDAVDTGPSCISEIEVRDGLDNDCDGDVDEGVQLTWYADADGDGFGDLSVPTTSCRQPPGFVDVSEADTAEGISDCDDHDASIHPGATETCNDVDDDCDESVDEGLPSSTWYVDLDWDGFGSTAYPILDCEAPTGYTDNADDCDDTDGTIHPGAEETCDGADDDCDGLRDEDLPTLTWSPDDDYDGYGDASIIIERCLHPPGHIDEHTDCNDRDPGSHPGAEEVCDRVDNDCDGTINEGFDTTTTWYDADHDGWGDTDVSEASCEVTEGWVTTFGDCDDADRSTYPGAFEDCDDVDSDCDGSLDEGCELCSDGLDNDDDGLVDCEDGSCYLDPTCGESDCADGLDDDADGLTDCDDDDCWGARMRRRPLPDPRRDAPLQQRRRRVLRHPYRDLRRPGAGLGLRRREAALPRRRGLLHLHVVVRVGPPMRRPGRLPLRHAGRLQGEPRVPGPVFVRAAPAGPLDLERVLGERPRLGLVRGAAGRPAPGVGNRHRHLLSP